jgi:hypothetical protein
MSDWPRTELARATGPAHRAAHIAVIRAAVAQAPAAIRRSPLAALRKLLLRVIVSVSVARHRKRCTRPELCLQSQSHQASQEDQPASRLAAH